MQTLIVEANKTIVLPVFKTPDGDFEVAYENFTRSFTHESLKRTFEGGALVDDGPISYLVLPKTPQEDASWLTPVELYLQEFKVEEGEVENWMRIYKDDVWTPILITKNGASPVIETLSYEEFFHRRVLPTEMFPIDQTLHYSDYFYRVHSSREYVELTRFRGEETPADFIEWL